MCFSTLARSSTRVFSSVVHVRGVSGLERMLPTISPEKLAAVPIHPLDKDTLARQLKMEGMMDVARMAGGKDADGDRTGGPGHGGMGRGGMGRGGMGRAKKDHK